MDLKKIQDILKNYEIISVLILRVFLGPFI